MINKTLKNVLLFGVCCGCRYGNSCTNINPKFGPTNKSDNSIRAFYCEEYHARFNYYQDKLDRCDIW